MPAYADAVILRGTAFGQPESGIRADTKEWPGLDAFVVVDKNNQNRFPPRDGTDGANALTADEVRTIIGEAIKVAHRTRAQVRRPLGSPAGETIVITDTNGVVLGIGRTRDALVDAIDVTTQKARTAAFFSGDYAAGDIELGAARELFRRHGRQRRGEHHHASRRVRHRNTSRAQRAFLGQPTALADGKIAYSDRAVGLLAQPFYPSGVPGAPNGPLSLPFNLWSPFQTGLELDLSYNQILLSIAYILNQDGLAINIDGATVAPAPTAANPTPLPDVLPGSCTGIPRIANGITLFPGSFPIYRNGKLVGGIGASGDGSDQSDLVAFLGLSNGAAVLNTGIQQAPANIRSDTLAPVNARLLYVQCPQAPFTDTNDANVCEGK